jgi:formylglycine-generating enzyme required for sulfatase activity
MFGVLNTKILIKAALVGAAPMAGALGLASLPPSRQEPGPTVFVDAGSFLYREAGDYARGGRPVNAPLTRRRVAAGLHVMKRQVSAAEYEACVADDACAPRAAREDSRADMPVTGVNWHDATSYAAWYSARTGDTWRLPTDVEWAYVAGARFKDDAVAADDGSDGFTKRWLAKYDQESYRQPTTDKTPKPMGTFGENERGVTDLSGNVWEWTDTCFVRQAVAADGGLGGARTVNCGVRVVEGEHRSYVTDFIRDARAGGCAVGIPPAKLGFRLVREEGSVLGRLTARLRSRLGRAV